MKTKKTSFALISTLLISTASWGSTSDGMQIKLIRTTKAESQVKKTAPSHKISLASALVNAENEMQLAFQNIQQHKASDK